MSISTSIEFRNANDPKYIAAATGSFASLEKWEDEHGPVVDRTGARLENKFYEPIQDGIEETGAEYGGWVIDLSKIPPSATHVVIHRG